LSFVLVLLIVAHTVRRYSKGSIKNKLTSFGLIVAEGGELVECAKEESYQSDTILPGCKKGPAGKRCASPPGHCGFCVKMRKGWIIVSVYSSSPTCSIKIRNPNPLPAGFKFGFLQYGRVEQKYVVLNTGIHPLLFFVSAFSSADQSTICGQVLGQTISGSKNQSRAERSIKIICRL
jgi:hypothetical protein